MSLPSLPSKSGFQSLKDDEHFMGLADSRRPSMAAVVEAERAGGGTRREAELRW